MTRCTLSIRSFGCRLNQSESAALAARFAAAGFDLRGERETASVCVVLTCAITRTAERACLRWMRHLDRRRPRPLVVLAGCLADAVVLAPEDRRRIDVRVGRSRKWDLPAILAERMNTAAGACRAATLPSGEDGPTPLFRGARAWLRIQDGCDFDCAYCIVPRARGTPRSRPFDAVLAEARALIAAGYAELVLTGANIACYRDGTGRNLIGLTQALIGLPGVFRLRVGSIEPGTIEAQIVDLMASEPRLCRSLHLPLQSADATVLRAMRRRYTPDQFRAAVRAALRLLPDLGLGADVITGFPGEDADAFGQTRALIEELPFSNLHVFPYSERPGTDAADFGARVPVAERKKRAAALIELGHEKRAAFAGRFVGREVAVLIERRLPKGRFLGHTGEYLEAELTDADALAPGRLKRAVVREVRGGRLIARST